MQNFMPEINSRQNVLIYSTILGRRSRQFWLLHHIIYARFNFILCLTNATPNRPLKYVILTPSRLRPSDTKLPRPIPLHHQKKKRSKVPQGSDKEPGINMPPDCSTLMATDINRL